MKHHALAQQTLQNLSENAIYLMGLSFLLGSLFTIFVLIVLDAMRTNRTGKSTGKK